MPAETSSPEWLSQLAAIEWPAPPDWTWFYLTAIAVTGAACAIVAYYLLRRRRAPHRAARHTLALEKLATLQHAWQHGVLGDRAVAYQLATILRLGLGMNQLTSAPPILSTLDEQAWRKTIAMLERHRYASSAAANLPSSLFDTVRDWIRLAAGREAQT